MASLLLFIFGVLLCINDHTGWGVLCLILAVLAFRD
jgi:hypothetical protein